MPSIISHHYKIDNTTDTTTQASDSANQGNPQNTQLPNSYETHESLSSNQTTNTINASDRETGSTGLFSQIKQKIQNFINKINPFYKNNNANNINTNQSTIPTAINTKTWIENEIKTLRTLLESGDLHIDNFVIELARLASLSFFYSGQIEKDEIKRRYDELLHLFKEQQKLYNDNKVYAADMTNAILCGIGGTVGMFIPNVATAATTISQGGASVTKVLGNTVEREKTELQHMIDQMIKTNDDRRNNSSSADQISTKLGDQLTKVQDMHQNLVTELNR